VSEVSEEPVDGVTTDGSQLRFAELGDLGMPEDMVRTSSETHVSHFGPEGYIFPPPRDEALLRRRLDHELERRGVGMQVINVPAT
jgi:hypothetical protein